LRISPGNRTPRGVPDKPLKDLVTRILREGGFVPSPGIVENLCAYLEGLDAWNRRMNLTGLKDVGEMAVKHVGDTLTLTAALPPSTRTVLDIGTGAGVPGLVLKLLRPDLEIVLVDSIRKRISFLKTVIAVMGLEGVWAEQGRVGTERGVPHGRPEGGFDVIVSQAVGSIDELARMACPLLARQGVVILMKGPKAAGELEAKRDELVGKGWGVELMETRVPVTGHVRNLILLRRVGT
jgi:16S rRNA (guanine527-N7)-methyltransferase